MKFPNYQDMAEARRVIDEQINQISTLVCPPSYPGGANLVNVDPASDYIDARIERAREALSRFAAAAKGEAR